MADRVLSTQGEAVAEEGQTLDGHVVFDFAVGKEIAANAFAEGQQSAQLELRTRDCYATAAVTLRDGHQCGTCHRLRLTDAKFASRNVVDVAAQFVGRENQRAGPVLEKRVDAVDDDRARGRLIFRRGLLQ